MSEIDQALVNSNVIIDIIGQDAHWMSWSMNTLSQYEQTFVNPLVFSGLCYLRPSVVEVEEVLASLDLGYAELPKDTLFLAAQAYTHYHQRGGMKNAPLVDFLIGAHAAALGVPILTRDVGRYQAYFPMVTLISP
ncbi:MAG: putative nucleic acid-binding protein [Verrucomicrobiales bacterium]|jgi:predicted nucleic acid-binding protein